MIFSRKYVFETKRTKARRFLLNAGVGLLFVAFTYATFLFYILMVAQSERNRAAEGLYQKSPESIVVFTGDRGRLARALELLKKWPTAKLLISGVHGANNLSSLVAGQTDAQALLQSGTQVELDYDAQDTMGNVRETLEYLRHSPDKTERVLVVTSDYHVLRVRMIFQKEMGAQAPMQIFFDGIQTGRSSWPETKKLLKESIKIARGWFILNVGQSSNS